MTKISEADLRQARTVAVDASLEADEIEAQARRARRSATAKMKHYEHMLSIMQGQMELPYEEEK